MTNFAPPNYLQDAARTVAEMKLIFEQNLEATKELVGGLPVTTLTISGTTITPPAGGNAAQVRVATPGGAATANLTNCVPTNLKDGTWMALRMANAGQVVVVKHAAGGAGQFALAGNADLALADPTVVVLLALSGTLWEEIGRFYGTQVTAARTFYQVAGLGQNRFTGRQEWCFGANLTAAATLPLGVDGNAFLVLGTATIYGLSAAPLGTIITLMFNNNPLLVNNNSIFNLGGYNIQTTAGQMMQFISIGAGAWRLLGGGSGGQSVITLDRMAAPYGVTTSVPIYSYTVQGNTLTGGRRLRFIAEAMLSHDPAQGLGVPRINYAIGIDLNFGGVTLCRLLINTAIVSSSSGDPATAYRALFPPGLGGHLIATLADYGGGLVGAMSWHSPVYFSEVGPMGIAVSGLDAYIGYGTGAGFDVTVPQAFWISTEMHDPGRQTLAFGHGVLTLE